MADAADRSDFGLEGGQVGTGNVSSALLAADPKAPFGLRLDPDAVVGAVQDGWAKNRVMFVELSDLERAEQAESKRKKGKP